MSNNNSNCMKRGAILVRIYVKSTYYFIHARTDINVCIVYEGKKRKCVFGTQRDRHKNKNQYEWHVYAYYVVLCAKWWIVR